MTDLGAAAKLRAAFELSPTILAVSSLDDGRMLEVNDAFLRATGYTREEIIGRPIPDLGLWVDPGLRESGLANLRAGRPVREDGLPRLQVAELEESLPRGQARDRQARAHCEVDVARQRREVPCLDGNVLRQSTVAIPVGEAEHALPDREARRAITDGTDHACQLMSGDRRCSVAAEAIGPGGGPCELSSDEP